jgi:hypothetical protein
MLGVWGSSLRLPLQRINLRGMQGLVYTTQIHVLHNDVQSQRCIRTLLYFILPVYCVIEKLIGKKNEKYNSIYFLHNKSTLTFS